MFTLTRAALRAPRFTLVLVLVLTIGLGAGGLWLRTDAGFRAYVGALVIDLASSESAASVGFLSGVAILVALVADLVILPAVIASGARLERRRAA